MSIYNTLLAYGTSLTTTIVIPVWTGIALANANEPAAPFVTMPLPAVNNSVSGAYVGGQIKPTSDDDWLPMSAQLGLLGFAGGLSIAPSVHMLAYNVTLAYNKIPEAVRNQIKMAVHDLITSPELTDLLPL